MWHALHLGTVKIPKQVSYLQDPFIFTLAPKKTTFAPVNTQHPKFFLSFIKIKKLILLQQLRTAVLLTRIFVK
jgi:hypothetical protein